MRREAQLTNWPWFLASSAHAPMRSEIVQPLGSKTLGTSELQLSMTTVALKSELGHSSSYLGDINAPRTVSELGSKGYLIATDSFVSQEQVGQSFTVQRIAKINDLGQ